MSSTGGTRGVIILLVTAAVVHGQNGWGVSYTSSEICALVGSTVEMRCSYKFPNVISNEVDQEFWFIENHNDLKNCSNYSKRVEYHCEKQVCILKIKNLTKSDSAVYKFRFMTKIPHEKYTGLPGVTLSVTDLKVKERISVISRKHNFSRLECHTSCNLPKDVSYVWFRDGQEFSQQISKYYSVSIHEAKAISCSVTGHENIRSPKLSVEDNQGVIESSFEICAIRGSTLKISCDYTYRPITTSQQKKFCFTAMENNQHVNVKNTLRDRTEYHCDASVCTLSISNLIDNDSDEYEFNFTSNNENAGYISSVGVTLSVRDSHIQVNVERSGSQIRDLVCQSNCWQPYHVSYVWYKNGQILSEEKKKRLQKIIDPADSYQCSVDGYKDRSLAVYAPRLPSVSVSPTGVIVEGTFVRLTCSSDAHPAANYSWIKKNGRQSSHLLSSEPYLVFSSIKSTDSGDYRCTAESDLGINSTLTFIDVQYAPRLPSVSVSPTGAIVEGTSVRLTCSSDAHPAANYSWIKKNGRQSSHLLSSEPYLVFSSIKSTDSGDYRCTAESDLGINSTLTFIDVQYAPRLPSVSVSPTGAIVEGTSVRLTCSSDAHPAANYSWIKKNGRQSSHLLSSEPYLVFSSIKSTDSGDYRCTAESDLGINSTLTFIDVQYAPRLPSVSVNATGVIVEGTSVLLTCSSDARPPPNYTWYKKNKGLLQASGQNFIITNTNPSHSGYYYCEAWNKRGNHNSTIHHLTIVAASSQAGKIVIIGIGSVIFLAIILYVFLLFRKKRPTRSIPESGERPDNSEQCQHIHPERQGNHPEDIHYASVRFLRNQTDPIYCNIRVAGAHRPNEEECESVEYATVNFTNIRSDPRTAGQPGEDSSSLYSVVNKIR